MGPPTFFAVALPAGRGLGTPAARRLLANTEAVVSPSGRVTTLGVRHKRISTLSQHFRGRGHPYGLQDALPPLRPSCASWPALRLRHGRPTRCGGVASPSPTETLILEDTPSFSWRYNAQAHLRLWSIAE